MNAALPVAVVALGAAVALAPRAAPAEVLVEMEVVGVFPLEDAHAGLVVLKQKGGALLLPIVVGTGEADVLTRRLRKQAPLRPRTHDLLDHTIAALGGRVVRVEIHDASSAVYRARVFLAQGAQRVELDARPSDSIALAMGASAPIFADRHLVEGSGLREDELDRLRGAGRRRADDESASLQPEQRM